MTDASCDIYTAKLKSIKKTSPATLNSNRAIPLSKTDSIIASDNKIINVKVELPVIENKIYSKIKGIPSAVKIETLKETVYDTKLKHEIQSIKSSSDNTKISAIDSTGSLWIANYNQGGDNFENNIVNQYTIQYDNNHFSELGWAGSTFNPSDSNIIAKTQFYQKKVQIYTGDQLSQTIQLIQNPTQISYFTHEKSSTSLLALAEFNQLKIYDPRQSTNNSCIQKFSPSTSWIYALSVSPNSEFIAVGGSSRTVSVFDTKKWTNSGNWKNCLKYEITNIEFSNKKPTICYVGGLDSEVLAGEWNGSSGVDHFTGVRVDSKWLGLSKLKDQEYLFGFTGSSSIYYVDNCDRLFQSTTNKGYTIQGNKEDKKLQHQQANQLKKEQQQTEDSNEIGKPRHIEGSPKGEKHILKKLKKDE